MDTCIDYTVQVPANISCQGNHTDHLTRKLGKASPRFGEQVPIMIVFCSRVNKALL